MIVKTTSFTVRVSEQENVAQLPLMPNLSHLDASDDLEDQELLPEGEETEELIVLDPEHVCSFSFNIYAIMVKWLDFVLQLLKEGNGITVLFMCQVHLCVACNGSA